MESIPLLSIKLNLQPAPQLVDVQSVHDLLAIPSKVLAFVVAISLTSKFSSHSCLNKNSRNN
jgi:hypothetical protein